MRDGRVVHGDGTSGGAANGGRVGHDPVAGHHAAEEDGAGQRQLIGEEGETRDVRLGREFKIGRVYEFRDVPPGPTVWSPRLAARPCGT